MGKNKSKELQFIEKYNSLNDRVQKFLDDLEAEGFSIQDRVLISKIVEIKLRKSIQENAFNRIKKIIEEKDKKNGYPEKWEPIKSKDGKTDIGYEISSLGRLRKKIKEGEDAEELNVKSVGSVTVGGYLSFNKSPKNLETKVMHRLVAMHFLKRPEGCNVVNHISEDPSDNRVINLEWTTLQGNAKHGYARIKTLIAQGLKPYRIICEQTDDIFDSAKQAAEIIKKSNKEAYKKAKNNHTKKTLKDYIGDVLRGERKEFDGLSFKYET